MEFYPLRLLLLLTSLIYAGHSEERKKAIVTLKPKWTKLFKGDSVLLRCDVEGEVSSDWEYIWYKDEEELHPYKSWSENSEYHIGPADEAHSGDYACVGMRKTDSVFSHMSDTITLTVSDRPKAVLIRRPNWAQVFGGENVIFRCDIQGELPSDWKYTWRKDGQKVKWETAGDANQYRLSHVDLADSGKYTCVGMRRHDYKFSHASKSLTLMVADRPMPVVTLTPTETQIFSGQSVSLTCDILSGKPQDWKYSWFKKGYLAYNQVSSEQEYRISPANESHSGDYTCRGTRKSDSQNSRTSEAISLSVLALPTPAVTVAPQSPVYTGETITLKCVLEISSGWSFKWFKGSSQNALPPSDHYSRAGDTLTILGASESDQDEYWCQGYIWNMSISSFISQSLNLTITNLPIPELTVDPQGPVFTGETVTLKCGLATSGGWRYKWYKGSSQTEVSQSDHYHRAGDTLTISGAAEIDQDHYWCQGSRDTRPKSSYVSNYVYLTVTALPVATLTIEPQSLVFTGEMVTLKCVVESFSDWRYKWYKGRSHTEVPQSDRYSRAGSTLTIRGAAESDQDRYWCQGERATTPMSSVISCNESLVVQGSKPNPKLSSDRAEQVFTGSSVTLSCEANLSAGWEFYWYRHTPNSDPVGQTAVNSYTISSIKVSDGGQYWCSAGRGNPVFYTHYSNAVWVKVTERPKAAVTLLSNWTQIFSGETISLRCDIRNIMNNNWEFIWYKNGHLNNPVNREREYRVTFVYGHQGDEYTCIGRRRSDFTYSKMSNAYRVTVSERPQAVLRVPPHNWLSEGDSATLSCEVEGSATGWRFLWYRVDSTVKHTLLHRNDGSYSLSPAAIKHTGLYVCRAERGEPAYYTKYSRPQPLWITGSSPAASVVISPNRSQHFTYSTFSLSCDVQDNSSGWRLRWFTGREWLECPSSWSSEMGHTCTISYPYTSDSGVYWCQSDSRATSLAINVTVHDGDVILESPAQPVIEGNPLTLRCMHRSEPTSLSADFYKDGLRLQTQSTGHMTIPAVSKIHEGLYHCRSPDRGTSPKSWVSVRPRESDSHILQAMGWVMIVTFILAFILIVLVLHYCNILKGTCCDGIASNEQQHRRNPCVNQRQNQPGGIECVQPLYLAQHSISPTSAAGPSVIFADIELKQLDIKGCYKDHERIPCGRDHLNDWEVSILI